MAKVMKKAKLGSLSGKIASTKRVGASDKGAWYQEQVATLRGAKGSVSLKKDKELNASAAERKQAGAKAKKGATVKKKTGSKKR